MGIMLQFSYRGGSHPGKVRTVYEASLTALPRTGYFTGVDMESGEFRRFLVSSCQNLVTVPATEILMDRLPKTYKASQVVADYKAEGKLAIFDASNNRVVVVDKPKPSGTAIKFSTSLVGGNPSIYIDGKYGIVRLSAGPGGVQLYRDGTSQQTDAETLLKHLTKVLNG